MSKALSVSQSTVLNGALVQVSFANDGLVDIVTLNDGVLSPTDTAPQVLSPRKYVEALGVPVADNLARPIVPSDTVPTFNTSPNTVMKSMLSEPVRAEANTMLEPDIV